MRRGMLVLLAAPALAGCLGVRGMDQIVGLQGAPTATVEKTIFRSDFNSALADRTGAIPAGLTSHPTTHVTPMLRSGMMYVRTYCNDYFRRMAIEQRESRIIRDSLAPLSALIIGLAGIRDFSSNEASEDDVIALLGLLTATSASALDVYDKHLLFGAENIDSVRTLTMKALETHKQAILEEQGYGFEDAIELLLEHQNICSPQAILALTRKAIQAAEPEPDEDGAPAAAAPAAAAAAAAPAAPARPAGSPPRVPIGIKIKQQ